MKNVPNLAQAEADIAAIEGRWPDLFLRIPLRPAWTLFSLLQLALRHSGVTGALRTDGEKLARGLQDYCGATPSLAIVAEGGWDAEFDEERAGSIESDAAAHQAAEGGANPTPALHEPPPAADLIAIDDTGAGPEVAGILRDMGEDIARAFAGRIAARRVLQSPVLAGSDVHRVTLLLDPPSTAGLIVFTGDRTAAEFVTSNVRHILTRLVLDALREVKGK